MRSSLYYIIEAILTKGTTGAFMHSATNTTSSKGYDVDSSEIEGVSEGLTTSQSVAKYDPTCSTLPRRVDRRHRSRTVVPLPLSLH